MPLARIAALLRTPTLQNTGSTARDHLASERTFLSWLRTGLGFVALGVAVERFSRFELEVGTVPLLPHQRFGVGGVGGGWKTDSSSGVAEANDEKEQERAATARVKRTQEHVEREQVLVAALLGTGSGSIAYGAARYFSTLKLLERGLFKPAYGGAGALGLAVAALAGCAWWGMVREEFEMSSKRKEKEKTAVVEDKARKV